MTDGGDVLDQEILALREESGRLPLAAQRALVTKLREVMRRLRARRSRRA